MRNWNPEGEFKTKFPSLDQFIFDLDLDLDQAITEGA